MNDIDQTALEIARAFIPVDVVGQQRANLQMAIIEAIKKHANPKTLADVQPGGRVRLGGCNSLAERITDHLCNNEYDIGGRAELLSCVSEAIAADARERFEAWARLRGHTLTRAADGEYCFISVRNLWTQWQAALSAQPSSGGQGDRPLRVFSAGVWTYDGTGQSFSHEDMDAAAFVVYRDAALAARQPVSDQHPDDLAVDAFAAAMKAKMAAARAKGRGGWEDPAQCTAEDLSRMLRNHVEKGDPRDVANFCMMLHQRGEAIAARQPVGEAVTVEAVATVRRNGDGDRYIDWLTEGGIADLEVGDVLMVSDRAITDEDGSGEVYAAPPAQAVDLGEMPDGWRLSKKTTCYQLSHGNDIIGNLVGPDAEENAAIIARVLDSQAVGNGN